MNFGTDGTTLNQVVALTGDETGLVRIRLVGDQCGLVKAGNVIAVRNGRAEVFKEKMRIEVDKWGKISEEKGHEIKEVTGKNISEVLYETKIIKASESHGDEERKPQGGYRGGRGGRGGYNSYKDRR